tara:strand:+ start:18441 stop:19124 length:684 start_codon:yes stop_codon:yes gene_type:complete
MAQFNINTDAAVVMTNKLEKLHRSALPVAIRRTLDGAAFDVKQRTLLSTTAKTFENRKKTFFKSKSRVFKAKGFNVKTMKSMIGFIDGDKQAVDDLEKQERGGSIRGRTFIPLDSARISNSLKKNVRKKNRISGIRDVERIRKKKNFHKVVNKVGVGGHVIYKHTLFEISRINRGKIKLKGLFSFQKTRSARVKATHFMQRSANQSARKIPSIFNIEGKKQIKRLMK